MSGATLTASFGGVSGTKFPCKERVLPSLGPKLPSQSKAIHLQGFKNRAESIAKAIKLNTTSHYNHHQPITTKKFLDGLAAYIV